MDADQAFAGIPSDAVTSFNYTDSRGRLVEYTHTWVGSLHAVLRGENDEVPVVTKDLKVSKTLRLIWDDETGYKEIKR